MINLYVLKLLNPISVKQEASRKVILHADGECFLGQTFSIMYQC